LTPSAFAIVVKDQPDKPPSIAQLEIRKSMESNQDEQNDVKLFTSSLVSLFKNLNYCLILVSYGINTGVYYAIGTLLNQMLVNYYKVTFKDFHFSF
jgi:FLVCR family feline leukemia virus subgroup C receptor-related protein